MRGKPNKCLQSNETLLMLFNTFQLDNCTTYRSESELCEVWQCWAKPSPSPIPQMSILDIVFTVIGVVAALVFMLCIIRCIKRCRQRRPLTRTDGEDDSNRMAENYLAEEAASTTGIIRNSGNFTFISLLY